MAAEKIGRCKCPLCGSENARLSLAKTNLPVLTCNGCNIQMFCRSDNSDRRARALLIPDAKPAADTTAPPPAPALPAGYTAPPPAPQPRPAWGLFGAAP
jgi:hypothetical protein